MESASAPGIKTSEFWAVMISAIISILASIGVITQSQATTLVSGLPVIMSYLGTAAAAVVYIRSRANLKASWLGIVAAQQPANVLQPALPLVPDSPPAPSYGATAVPTSTDVLPTTRASASSV